jgi:hypothetical protein
MTATQMIQTVLIVALRTTLDKTAEKVDEDQEEGNGSPLRGVTPLVLNSRKTNSAPFWTD